MIIFLIVIFLIITIAVSFVSYNMGYKEGTENFISCSKTDLEFLNNKIKKIYGVVDRNGI